MTPGAVEPGEGAPPGRFPPGSTPLVAAVGRFAGVVVEDEVEFPPDDVELPLDVEFPEVVVELLGEDVEFDGVLFVVLFPEFVGCGELLLDAGEQFACHDGRDGEDCRADAHRLARG